MADGAARVARNQNVVVIEAGIAAAAKARGQHPHLFVLRVQRSQETRCWRCAYQRAASLRGWRVTCDNCGGKGLVILNWTDAEPDYGVCLCEIGQALRRRDNCGRVTVPLWQVWAARHQVPHDRVFLLEHVLDAEELAVLGFADGTPEPNREAALLASGRKVKR